MNFFKNFFGFPQKEKIEFYDSFQDIISSKKDYCESILSFLASETDNLKKFLKKIKDMTPKLKKIEVFPEEKDIHNLIQSIHEEIIEKFEGSLKIFSELNNHFSQFKQNLEDETQIYDVYKDIFVELKNDKTILEQRKKKYHELGKEMEYQIIQFVGNNYLVLNQINQNEFLMADLDQITFPPHISFEDYEKKLKNTNIVIEQFNKIQNKFFNFLPEVIAKDEVIYFNLINTYANLL